MKPAVAPTAVGPEAYQSWRATALGAVTEAIEQRLVLELMGNLEGAHVLDASCGDGMLSCAAALRGGLVTGVDPNPAMVAAARARADRSGIDASLAEGGIARLPFADGSFDVVVAITVLCFVADAQGAARELARVLRPGGRLVVGELGRWSLWAAIRRVRGWLGAAIWKAARFRTARELRALAAQAGLRARTVAGISASLSSTPPSEPLGKSAVSDSVNVVSVLTTVRGAVFYPPIGLSARLLSPLDPWLGRLTTGGAAFIALAAVKDTGHAEHRS